MEIGKVLRHKHVVLAMLLSPVLAVMAYFAVDQFVSEPPEPIQAGQSYPLLASSACRYASGACRLSNGDLEIWLKAVEPTSELSGEPQGPRLRLSSSHPIAQLIVGVDEQPPRPVKFSALTDEAAPWLLPLPSQAQRLRLVAVVNKSRFFVELPLDFVIAQAQDV